jgi:hypothetical protein
MVARPLSSEWMAPERHLTVKREIEVILLVRMVAEGKV